MNKYTTKRRPLAHQACKALVALGLTVAAGFYAMPSRAQWIVEDPVAIAKSVEEYANQLQRWLETAQHYRDQVQFWQDNLTALQSLQFDLLRTQQQFKKVSDDFGVTEACPGASTSLLSGDITSALTSVVGNLTGDIASQQNAVCVMIRRTKNQRYNNTVDYLNQVTKQTDTLSKLASMRLNLVGTSPGKTQALQEDTGRFSVNVAQARDSWKTTDEQLAAQIAALQDKQGMLGRQMMNGKTEVLGTVINAAILETALKVGN
ncbi:hypothetical protein [Luteibacter yeojuensis]|uniref:Type IV secretion system protein VirB5 n=1 Tax=Luteibacter yeojuensis TaxID=345309 RepID=A0A0F3K4B7_9GAMM|nr:hypothetical protein [Luteibacter yeojuensis]KJV26031.1 hypothetical protein VI08_19410 [Luteibacter yeojuensis]